MNAALALDTHVFGLDAEDVHVWAKRLATVSSPAALSADESARARRFRYEHDRSRYVASRTWLRAVLSVYTGLPSSTLRFAYGKVGKPELVPQMRSVHFNLAHSRDLAMIAVARTGPVGIDVELADTKPLEPEAAGLVLSEAENRLIEDGEDFLRVWVRKEAYAKALGSGLERNLAGLTLTPQQEPSSEGGIRVSDISMKDALAAVAAPSRLSTTFLGWWEDDGGRTG